MHVGLVPSSLVEGVMTDPGCGPHGRGAVACERAGRANTVPVQTTMSPVTDPFKCPCQDRGEGTIQETTVLDNRCFASSPPGSGSRGGRGGRRAAVVGQRPTSRMDHIHGWSSSLTHRQWCEVYLKILVDALPLLTRPDAETDLTRNKAPSKYTCLLQTKSSGCRVRSAQSFSSQADRHVPGAPTRRWTRFRLPGQPQSDPARAGMCCFGAVELPSWQLSGWHHAAV